MAYRKKEKAVVLDVDDTLVSFLSYLCFLHNKLHGTSLSEHDIKEWAFDNLDLTDVRGNKVTGEQLNETFHEYESEGLYARLPAIKESRFGVELMRDLGYKIILMTARKPEFHKQTILNLISNKIDYDELYFTKEKVKKINALAKDYNIMLFADDKYETVLDVYENAKIHKNGQVCLINKSHNQDKELDEGILRINTVFEAVRFLKKVK